MSRLRESQASQPPSGSRQTVLYVAVGGTMILIVALWVVVMPMQLARLRPGGGSGLLGAARPATGASDAAAEWNEAMRAAANDLERAAAQADAEEVAPFPAAETEAPPALADPKPLDAETLTDRLKAAAPDVPAAAPSSPSQNQ